MEQLNRTGLALKISGMLSGLFNPAFSLLFYFFYATSRQHSLSETIKIFLPLFFFIVLPMHVWLYLKVKRGKYTNMDVSDRQQRKGFYFLIAALLLLYIIYNIWANGHTERELIYLLALILALQLSNYRLKSSMHTALNIFVAALFFPLQPWLGVLWLVISAGVAISRLVLKRHSLTEVISGALLAMVISFIYLYQVYLV